MGTRPQFLTVFDRDRYLAIMTLFFVAFCAIHYFSCRPLWLDEEFILKNIQQFHGAQLFQPLEYSQAFPRVHLILIQQCAQLFDNHVLALRLASMAAMLAAFVIWMRIYRRESDHLVFALTLLAFTASYKMSYYAAELKPYAADVLVIGIYTWFVINLKSLLEKKSEWWITSLIILLPWLMLFSYAAIFGFWLITYNLFLEKNARRYFGLNLISSILALGAFYQLDLKYSFGMQGLHDYWQSYFIATNSLASFGDTFGDGVKKLATYWYGNSKCFIRLAVIFVPFVLYGMIVEGIRSMKAREGRIESVAAIGLILFIELVILGLLQRYPFTGERITLFIAPFIFYLTVSAMNLIKWRWVRYLLLGYFVIFCLFCLGNTVWTHVQEYNISFQ